MMDRAREPLMIEPATKPPTVPAAEPLSNDSIRHRWLRWDASRTVDPRSVVLRGVVAVDFVAMDFVVAAVSIGCVEVAGQQY